MSFGIASTVMVDGFGRARASHWWSDIRRSLHRDCIWLGGAGASHWIVWQGPEQAMKWPSTPSESLKMIDREPMKKMAGIASSVISRWLTENQWRLEKTTDVCTEDLLIGWRRLVWWEDKKAPGCMKVFKERLFPLQTISFLLAKLSLARPSLSGWL